MSGSVERGACVLKADATLAGVNDPLPSAPCAGPGYSGAVIPAFEVLLLSCVPMGCYEYLLLSTVRRAFVPCVPVGAVNGCYEHVREV